LRLHHSKIRTSEGPYAVVDQFRPEWLLQLTGTPNMETYEPLGPVQK
jgi:hypothetical protein